MDRDESLLSDLIRAGVVSAGAEAEPLPGGVSSDIVLVRDGDRRLVVKRALAKLRVRDDWHADVARNRTERRYLEVVAKLAPGRVPEILGHGGDGGGNPWFAMAYVEPPMSPWKQALQSGIVRRSHAAAAGATLARVHHATWGEPAMAAAFDTTEAFIALRIEPYLTTVANRYPDCAGRIHAEAERLAASRVCLVHGDYSPKNLMIDPRTPDGAPPDATPLVILDCEVAWFGDPAFDVGFLLNHLLLKALHHPDHRGALLASADSAWSSYAEALGEARAAEVCPRVATLLPMLMLARVDGKSPVEYLEPDERDRVRGAARRWIFEPPPAVAAILRAWGDELG